MSWHWILKQHLTNSFPSLKKKKQIHGIHLKNTQTATTKSGQRFKTEEENLVECNGNLYSIYFSVLSIEANNTLVVFKKVWMDYLSYLINFIINSPLRILNKSKELSRILKSTVNSLDIRVGEKLIWCQTHWRKIELKLIPKFKRSLLLIKNFDLKHSTISLNI